MSVSNLKSENDELDARKFMELNKLYRRNGNMYRYISRSLWDKYTFDHYDDDDFYEDECHREAELSQALYEGMNETTNDLYENYSDYESNPMSAAEFIRVNGLL